MHLRQAAEFENHRGVCPRSPIQPCPLLLSQLPLLPGPNIVVVEHQARAALAGLQEAIACRGGAEGQPLALQFQATRVT